jgi:hypothetical protein
MKMLILSAATLLAALTATTASAGQQPVTVLELLSITTHVAATAPANAEPRFGGRIWFHEDFYRWNGHARGARIGYGDTTGIATHEAIALSAVAHLPGGTIDVLGQATSGRINTYAVVGGTGRYAGTRGEIVVRDLGGENTTHQAITIRLSS